ncbi:MAG: hypothetical protein KDA61_07425, partial [Planctomycetales bacterium]|nr:hypothetical protein [Planctomycetales bacterium]
MAKHKGTLSKTKKGSYMVKFTNVKGKLVEKSVPASAKCFRDADFKPDVEVDVDVENDNVLKVAICGVEPVAAASIATPRRMEKGNAPRHRGHQHAESRDAERAPRIPTIKAKPSTLGLPFTNPYTFKPFAEDPPIRREPVFLTGEESCQGEERRFTGFVDLDVQTLRPLLTAAAERERHDSRKHQRLAALTIGDDVIVPATSVRGSLRSLVSLLTDGALNSLNPNVYLCQARDLQLFVPGNQKKMEAARAKNPNGVAYGVLASIERPGSVYEPGTVRLGATKLVLAQEIIAQLRQANIKPHEFRRLRKPLYAELDGHGKPVSVSETKNDQHAWHLKISGNPIGGDSHPRNKFKQEGAFLPSDQVLELPAELWEQFSERHAHSAKSTLKSGDLVWLEIEGLEGT